MYKVLYTFILLMLAASSIAKDSQGVEKTKVYEDSFAVDPLILLDLDVNESNVTIKTTDVPEISYKFTVKVRAEDEEDANRFIENTVPRTDKSPNEIELQMKLCVSKMVINNNRKKLKFSDGPWIKFLDYSMDLVISIPKTMKLDLSGSNNNVTLGDLDKDLKLKLYDSTLRAGKVKGNSIVELSYGDAYFASLNEVEKMKLYEMKFEAAEIKGDIDLKSSYSRVTMPDLDHLILRSYEDHLVFATVDDLSGQMSYSVMSAAGVNEWDAKSYESTVSIGEMHEMDLVSHYSTYNIGKLHALDIEKTYEDKFNLGQLDHLKGNGHYSKFEIESLGGSVDYKGYEDKIEIDWVAPTVTSLAFSGQYMELELDVSPQLTYSLDLKLQYPDIDYPADDFNGLFQKEGEKVVTVLVHKKGDANSARFIFDTYEGEIDIDKAIAR